MSIFNWNKISYFKADINNIPAEIVATNSFADILKYILELDPEQLFQNIFETIDGFTYPFDVVLHMELDVGFDWAIIPFHPFFNYHITEEIVNQ